MASGAKHKEYSLIFAAAAAVLLIIFGKTANTAGLLILNIMAIATIIYSAFSVVRHADVLAHRFGEPYGSLILSLAIVVLEVSLISILMLTGSAGATMMRDTIYSVVMIVMSGLIGISLLAGGYKYKSQFFNLKGIVHYLSSIIPLCIIVLVLPAAFEGNTLANWKLLIISAVCLMLYGAFLFIQTKTHRNFFVFDDEEEDSHAIPSRKNNLWHAGFLITHLIAVIGVTKLNSGPMEQLFYKFNLPASLKGFIVAVLILTPEGLGAFSSAMKNQVQRAINLFLGSVLATISLTMPIVTLIAVFTGQKLELGLDLPNIIILLATLMVCQTSLTTGKTNTHSGMAHIALFIIYIMLLF